MHLGTPSFLSSTANRGDTHNKRYVPVFLPDSFRISHHKKTQTDISVWVSLRVDGSAKEHQLLPTSSRISSAGSTPPTLSDRATAVSTWPSARVTGRGPMTGALSPDAVTVTK